MANNFDFEAALKQLQSGQPLTGENGILTPLIKQLTEATLNAEIENYLEENPKPSNLLSFSCAKVGPKPSRCSEIM